MAERRLVQLRVRLPQSRDCRPTALAAVEPVVGLAAVAKLAALRRARLAVALAVAGPMPVVAAVAGSGQGLVAAAVAGRPMLHLAAVLHLAAHPCLAGAARSRGYRIRA